MAPDNRSIIRIGPDLKGITREEIQRLFYKTQTKDVYTDPGTQGGGGLIEDAKGENFMDIHIVGQRDSKYMKYQHKHAPLITRTACESVRAYKPHDLSGGSVNAEIADLVKSKQGVGRPTVHPRFDAVTKYTDDFRKYSKREARSAIREGYVPIIPCTDDGRPSHPLRGTDRMEEVCSHEHALFRAHPLDLAKAEKAIAPKPTLGPVSHMVPLTSAYREEFFSDKGVPRIYKRKPTRCKSAPALRGPIEALPNWMRQSVATGKGWAASRVVPQRPLFQESSASGQRACARPSSAGALGSERVSNCSVTRPPGSFISAEARMEGKPQRSHRPASAGAIGSSSGSRF